MGRTRTCILVVACILVATTAALAMAVAWDPKHQCVAQFPKIIGCALASYESLSGGLVAAGGALFAGWLLWTATREQIDLAQQAAKQSERLRLQLELRNAENELSKLSKGKEAAERFQRKLIEGLKAPSPYAERLCELWRAQDFPSAAGDWHSTTMGSRLSDAAIRIRNLAGQIESGFQPNWSAQQRLAYSQMQDTNAKGAVKTYQVVVAELDTHIAHQSDVVEEARRRLEAAEKS
jgi:hypothetical protein